MNSLFLPPRDGIVISLCCLPIVTLILLILPVKAGALLNHLVCLV